MMNILTLLILILLNATFGYAQENVASSSHAKIIDKLIGEKKYLKDKLSATIDEKESLETQVKDLKKQLGQFFGPTTTADSTIEDLTLQKKALLEQITEIRQEKVGLNAQIEELRGKLKEREMDFQERFNAANAPYETKIEELTNNLNQVHQIIDEKDKAIETLQAKISGFNNEVKDAVDTKKKIEDQLENAHRETKNKEKKLVEKIDTLKTPYEEKIRSLEKELAEINETIKKKNVYIQSLTNEKNILAKEIYQKKKSKGQLEDQIKTNKEKVKNTDAKLKEKIEAVKTPYEDKMQVLQKQINDLKKEKASLLAQLGERKDESTLIKEVGAPPLNENVKQLKQALEEKDDQIRNIQQDRDGLSKELKALQLTSVKSNGSFEKIQQENDELKDRVQALSEEGKSLAKAKTELQKQIATYEQEMKGQEDERDLKTVAKLQKSNDDKLKQTISDVASRDEKIKDLADELRAAKEKLALALNEKKQAEAKIEEAQERYQKQETANERDIAKQTQPLFDQIKMLEEKQEKMEAAVQKNDGGEKTHLANQVKLLTEKLQDQTKIIAEKERLLAGADELSQQLATTKQERDQLKERLNSLHSEYETTKDAYEGKVVAASDELNLKVLSLEAKLKKSQADTDAALETQRAPLLEEITTLQDKLKITQQQINGKDQTISKLTDDKNNIEINLQKTLAEKEKMTDSVLQQKEELKKKESSLSQRIEDAAQGYKEQVKTLERELEQKNANIKNYATDLAKSVNDIKHLNTKIAGIESEKAKYQEQIESQKTQLAQVDGKFSDNLKKIEEQLNKLKADNLNLQKVNEKLQKESEADNVSSLALKNQLERSFQKEKELTQKLLDIRLPLKAEVSKLQNDLKTKDSSIAAMAGDYKKVLGEKEKITDLLNQQKQEAKIRETSLLEKTQKVTSDHSEQVKKLEQELEQKNSDIKNYTADLTRSINDLKSSNAKIAGTEAEKIKYQEQIESLKKQLAEVNGKFSDNLAQLQEELNKARSQNQHLQAATEKSQKESEALNASSLAFKNQLERSSQKEKELTQKLIDIRLPLKAEVQKLQDELKTKDSSAAAMLAEHKKQLDEKIKLAQSQEKQIANLIEQKETLEQQTQIKAKEASVLIQQLKDKDGMIGKLTADERQIEGNYKKALEEKQKIADAMNAQKQESSVRETALAQKVQEVASGYKEQMKSLEQSLKEKESAINGNVGALNKSANDLKSASEKLTNLENEKLKLQEQSISFKEQLAKDNDKFSSQLKELQEQLSKLRVDNQALEGTNSKLQNDWEALSAREQSLKAQLDRYTKKEIELTQKLMSLRVPLENKIKELQDELKQKDASTQTIAQDYQNKINEKAKLLQAKQTDLDVTLRQRQEVDKQLKNMIEKDADSKQQIKDLQSQLSQANSKMSLALQDVKIPLEKQLQMYKAKVDSNEKLVQAKEDALAKVQLECATKLESQNKEIVQGQERIKSVTSQLESIQKKHDAELAQSKIVLMNMVKELEEKEKSAQEAIKVRDEKVAGLEKKSNSISEQLAAKENNTLVLTKEINALNDKLKNLKMDSSNQVSKIKEPLEAKIALLNTALAEKENSIKELEATKVGMLKELSSIRGKDEDFKKKLSELEKQINSKDAVSASLIDQAKAPLLQQIKDLRNALVEKDALVLKKESNLNEIKNKIKDLEAALKKSTEESVKVKASLQASLQKDKFQESLVGKENEDKLKLMAEQLRALQEKTKGTERLLLQRENELAQLKNQNEQKQAAVVVTKVIPNADEVKQLQNNIQHLKENIVDKKNVIEQLSKEKENLLNELSRLQQESVPANNAVLTADEISEGKNIDTIKASLQASVKFLEKRLLEEENLAQEKETTIQELKGQIEKLQDELKNQQQPATATVK